MEKEPGEEERLAQLVAPLRVLVIPGMSQNIDIATEATLLANLDNRRELQIEVLPVADVTELRLVRRFTVEGQKYHGLHFLGHATTKEFVLPNGDALDSERIYSLCRDAGAIFAFLNACATGQIGQYLVNRQIAVAIVYAVDVLDRDAILVATRFYATLARAEGTFHERLRTSYVAAQLADGSLLWLTDGMFVRELLRPLVRRLDWYDLDRAANFEAFSSELKLLVQHVDLRLEMFDNRLLKLDNNQRLLTWSLFGLVMLLLVTILALVVVRGSF